MNGGALNDYLNMFGYNGQSGGGTQSDFYGFKIVNQQLILESGSGNFNANDYIEWFMAPNNTTLSLNNFGNLILNF